MQIYSFRPFRGPIYCQKKYCLKPKFLEKFFFFRTLLVPCFYFLFYFILFIFWGGKGGGEVGKGVEDNNYSKQFHIELTFCPEVVLSFCKCQPQRIFKVPKVLNCWSNFNPSLPPEDGQNQKQSSGYPNNSKSRPYLLSKLFALFGLFWVQGDPV